MTKEIPNWILQGRSSWTNTGRARPDFAIEPGPGQESVWDYPRPPIMVPEERLVTVETNGHEIARTTRAMRILETASPPTVYLPPDDVQTDLLKEAGGSSMCEWKGAASYWDLVIGNQTVKACAWSYSDPFPEFDTIRGYLSFYPAKLTCKVGAEIVRPQAGGFYGGWVTDAIVGPFKGEPGTQGW